MMRRPAGFDADPRRRQLLKELNNLPPPQLLAQHRLLGRIHTMQLKNTLGRVHSNADKIVHGRPPCLRSTTTSFWHIDAVGGRHPNSPWPSKVKKGLCSSAQKRVLAVWVPAFAGTTRAGPRLRGDDEGHAITPRSNRAARMFLPPKVRRRTGGLLRGPTRTQSDAAESPAARRRGGRWRNASARVRPSGAAIARPLRACRQTR